MQSKHIYVKHHCYDSDGPYAIRPNLKEQLTEVLRLSEMYCLSLCPDALSYLITLANIHFTFCTHFKLTHPLLYQVEEPTRCPAVLPPS